MPEDEVGVQMREAAWAAVLLAPRVDLAGVAPRHQHYHIFFGLLR